MVGRVVATENKVQIANVGQFLGLRTDTPASKCPANYSPDCSDMIFSTGGMDTRNPFRVLVTLPAEVVYRKEFNCKDGTTQILALDVNGVLYVVHQDGTYTQIDTVAPGSTVSSVTAYGREYMAFVRNGAGSDAPRQWDGKNIYRVSQGGPGAPPKVSNYSIPAVSLVTGSGGSPVAITSAEPINPTQVQTGGGEGPYSPPQYETYFTGLLFTTGAAHGLTAGEVVTIAGNSLYSVGTTTVSFVNSATEFEVNYFTQSISIGAGGTVTASAPFLVRTGNTVTANTATAHNLRTGYQVIISGVPDQNQTISSIVIDNETKPGYATFTTPSPHGLVPGNVIGVAGVPDTTVGGGITAWSNDGEVASVTTATDHGLTVGTPVVVQLSSFAAAPRIVTSVPSLNTFTFATGTGSGTGTSGSVELPWPLQSGTQFTVSEVLSDTTFEIEFSFNDGTWNGGTITFAWNGTFYVTSILSATSFTYRQNGPDALIQSGTGIVTPQGQIPAGDHLVCQHFITDTDFITAPSPSVKFTASGGKYVMVQDLAIGPSNTKARILSFTGANGSRFFMLLQPGQVNGLQVSTSTRVDDNVTTTALLDFSDLTLLAATAIDIPGNNLFQQVALNTPRGVRWYDDRMFWIGELNTVVGLVNMDMAGGTLSGSTAPLGWTQVGNGAIAEVGKMDSLVVTGPDSGEIRQGASTTVKGDSILAPNLNYALRFWMLDTGSGVTVPGDSIALTTEGNNYNTQIFTNGLDGTLMPGGSFASLTDLSVDVYIYIPSSTSSPQALEGPDMVYYSGTDEYYPSVQFDAYTGKIRLWSGGGSAALSVAPDIWDPTTYDATAFLANKDVWQHIKVHYSIDQSGNTFTYHDLYINDVAIFTNLGRSYSGSALVTPVGLKAQVQIDGSTVGAPSTTVYYDRWNVNAWNSGLSDGSGAPLYPSIEAYGPSHMTILSGTASSGGSNVGTGTATYNNAAPPRFVGKASGQFVGIISSASAAFSSTASFDLSNVTESGYYSVDFSTAMPASIPSDMILSLKFTDLTGVATYRDVQLIYADNPNRNPLARSSYVKNPEAYDALTGNIGPNDDSSELRALFVLQESLHFITAKGLYGVQQIGNSEPSSWVPYQVSDKCGAFHAESVTTGKGWAAWGGVDGAFWYGGGIPDKVSAILAPTWRKVANITNVYDDSDAERVYFGLIDGNNIKSMLVYDYHEVGLGGSGKWTPWNRPANWVCSSASGTVFVFGSKFYKLDSAAGTTDDDLGPIAGYYTFAPFGVSMFQKNYQYLGLRIAGAGVLTPFVFAKTLNTLTQALRGQDLGTLIDGIAEWPDNTRGRLMFLKLGQAGVQFSLEDATVVFQNDPNAPISGVR